VAALHLTEPSIVRARGGLVAVSVVAPDARRAEVLAEEAFVAGPDGGATLIEDAGACGLLVTDSGAVVRTRGFAAYEEVTAIDLDARGRATSEVATP
jgi:thiamine biosynthesis lipoprotein ApbE